MRARTALKGEIADLVRRAILNGAERVFAARGFEDARMTEIAREAGLATGTLYNYFASKDAIVHAIITEHGGELLARLEPIGSAAGPIEDVLRQLVEAIFEHMEVRRAMIPVIAQAGGRGLGAMRRAAPQAMFEKLFALFNRCLKRALRAGDLRRPGGVSLDDQAQALTFLLSGAIEAMAHAWLTEGQHNDLRGRAAFLVDMFLHGAADSA